MNLYSSTTPRAQLVRWDGIVVDVFDTTEEAREAGIWWTGHSVTRCTQHNPPNPVLVLLRDDGWQPDYAVHDRAGWVLSAIEMTPEELRDLGAADAHIAHARAVLERIISLAGKDAAWAAQ